MFLRAFSRWLIEEGSFLADNSELIAHVGEFMLARGIEVDRISTHIKILHPLSRSVWRIWERGRPVEERRPMHGLELDPSFRRSPVKVVWDKGIWIERRLDVPAGRWDAGGFELLSELREAGFTHYLIGPLIFSDREFHAISFATRAPGGFPPEVLALLEQAVPWLTPVIEVKGLRRATQMLMETYLGPDTFRLLIEGRVRLGEGQRLRAALWYSDMRGFTRLTEDVPLDQVVSVMNRYFGLVGAAADRHGGEVVQFIGDAILIYFAVLPELTQRDTCRHALCAAREARKALAEWNRERVSGGRCEIDFGVGLDFGDIIHVNVGSAGRQAFNILGPAVNRAARIEELTKSLGHPLLISQDFAKALGETCRPVGRLELRGVAEPVEVLEPEETAPDAPAETNPRRFPVRAGLRRLRALGRRR